MVDHIDGYGLNNQRANLRIATRSQNAVNTKNRTHNKTGYPGIYYDKSNNKFTAKLKVNQRCTNLGRSNTAEEAFEVYTKKRLEVFGEFAVQIRTKNSGYGP